MVAPLGETDSPAVRPSRSLQGAHRFVASTFLDAEERPTNRAARLPGWQAWLFTAWVLAAVAACLSVTKIF